MSSYSSKRMRRDGYEIFKAAVKAADPVQCVKRVVQFDGERIRLDDPQRSLCIEYSICDLSRIVVVGMGKASTQMARALEDILGDCITGGVINTKYHHAADLHRIEVVECGHPIPDREGVAGTRKLLKLLCQLDDKALVFCMISGGGSALMPAPADGLTLSEKQKTTQLLLECGATIFELNAIRKHLSSVKGGQLARAAYPAKITSLILSDVIGDPTDVIASGPTAPDESTFLDCIEILEKYKVTDQVPLKVLQRLRRGADGDIEETPQKDDRIFSNCTNLIVGNNRLSVDAAKDVASQLGYNTLVLSTRVEGETKEIAKMHAAIAVEIASSKVPISPPACVITGGETTVTVRGKGKGGRNQEFVLASALDIQGWDNIVVLSAGTDGTDGPTDAAGAIADGSTVKRAEQIGLSPAKYLRDNDSYDFFDPLDDLIITGPTGTNVMDIRLMMIGD